ncbi:MAG: DNA integrity scanning diadenylate cyclase DisA [Actinomycetota bacterium]|nr:DNA integrity scanning diadenylate cyclase DisA [Actinomycetota bacterium]
MAALSTISPGRPLRESLDRILQANKGALIIVGDGPEVLEICSGGFLVDSSFSPQRMSELAKMDGAIILASDAGRIARANVHLVPNPTVHTTETGTRHRTAERVARSIDVPVIAVSEDMQVITLYRGAHKHVLATVARLLGRANQALQTLERYRQRLDAVTTSLSALEVEDLVTQRDVTTVLQRAEMVRRIAAEVAGYIVELGTDGRLIRLQVDELLAGVEDDRRDVIRDYLVGESADTVDVALRALQGLETDQLLDAGLVADTVALAGRHRGAVDLDASAAPRGYRLLGRILRLPPLVIAHIVERCGNLQKVMGATVDELAAIDGVGDVTAVTVKDGLARLAESSILDRYS